MSAPYANSRDILNYLDGEKVQILIYFCLGNMENVEVMNLVGI